MLKKPIKDYKVEYPKSLKENYYDNCESCNTCNTCSNQSGDVSVCSDVGGW